MERGAPVVGQVAGDHQRLAVADEVDLGVELEAGVARQAPRGLKVRRHLGGRQDDLGGQQSRAEALALLRPKALGAEAHAVGVERHRVAGHVRRDGRRSAREAVRPRKSTYT